MSVRHGDPATRGQGGARRILASSRLRTGSQLDYPLIGIVATLLALGLVMVYSASFVQAQRLFDNPAYFFIRQMQWVALGTVALIAMARIPYRFWQRMAIPLMALALILLVAVLIFGEEGFGARRTFRGSIQPSEGAKLAIVIYVAAWVASKGKHLARLEAGLIPFAILMGLITALLVLEPSFSAAVIILIIGTTIFFVGGGDIKQLVIVGIMGSAVLLLLLWQSGYGFERIENWWKALSDPSQAGYNTSRALAIQQPGFGLAFGTDIKSWIQKSEVPLLWSDFLFANVGADLGFPGAVGVVALYAALGYRGLSIALNAPDQFSGLTAIGITTWILTQAVIHIGTSLALTPATGQPLPFMSYGGSAMVVCMAAIGLLLSIARASPDKETAYAQKPAHPAQGSTRNAKGSPGLASFALGWGDRRSRLSDSGRSQRPKGGRPAASERRSATSRRPARGPGATTRRPGSGQRR
jgi:cell division protein FtsW